MIIDFSVKNFFSFKENQSFQMIAAPIREKSEALNGNKCSIREDVDLLRSAVIYGANASGKSNFIKSLNFFRSLILTSASLTPEKDIAQVSFFLNSETRDKPSEFEMTFITNKRIYRYGFVVSRKDVLEEWLYTKDARESLVFERKGNEISIPQKYHILKELRAKKMIRHNALLLSLAAQFNDTISLEIYKWFLNFNIVFGLNDQLFTEYTIRLFEDPKTKNTIVRLLKVADTGIEDLKVVEQEGENLAVTIRGSDLQNPEVTKAKSVIKNLRSVKMVLNNKGKVMTTVDYPFDIFESEGTKKYFNLLGPILDTLNYGKVLVIDELDTKLHPLLTKEIVNLFNNEKTNPKNAQLIFATHDIHLLDSKIFRRDQIWFTEKQKDGSTNLFSLVDFKKGKTPRNDEKISKNYMYGKYGAVPYLADFDTLFEDFLKYNE